MKSLQRAIVCASIAIGGCAGNGEGLDENGRPLSGDTDADTDTLQPTFSSIQRHVFTPTCTGCHAGAAAPLGLRLEEGASYAMLVNAPSVEVPSLLRVAPGNPDASYLVQKLEGTAAVGARMPLGQPALPQATIAVIRQWIANGAQNDGAAASTKAAMQVVSLTALTAVSPQADEVLRASPAEIVVSASAALDLALLQADVITLQASGGDGTFSDGNEHTVALQITVRSMDPTVLAVTPALLPDDAYALRVSGTRPVALADLNGQPIDGDSDGIAGGDFILQFTVERAQ